MKTSTSLGLRTHKLASDCNKDTTKTELQEVTSSISKEVFFGLRSIPIFNIPSLLSSFILPSILNTAHPNLKKAEYPGEERNKTKQNKPYIRVNAPLAFE